MFQIVESIALVISIFSIGVISYGAVIAIIKFSKNEFGRVNGKFSFKNLNTIKSGFGYYLLLGLDFLIASDVIRTIEENTLHDLTILGVSVAIRTVLSYFLGKEIEEDQELKQNIDKEEKV